MAFWQRRKITIRAPDEASIPTICVSGVCNRKIQENAIIFPPGRLKNPITLRIPEAPGSALKNWAVQLYSAPPLQNFRRKFCFFHDRPPALFPPTIYAISGIDESGALSSTKREHARRGTLTPRFLRALKRRSVYLVASPPS